MKRILAIYCVLSLCGCAGTHKKGMAFVDVYDDVKVEQMTGNYVSGKYFGKTLFCLNARRETRRITAITNQVVTLVTNPVVSSVTNFFAISSTNVTGGVATNQLALTPMPTNTAGAGTNEDVALAPSSPPPPGAITNFAVLKISDSTLTTNVGANQAATAVNTQSGTTINSQITTNADNLAITVTSNQTIRTESSQTVTTVTNFSISASTNQVVTQTNQLVQDHFLFTELTPPPDFTLAPGESLVVLVDGVRHGFAPTNSSTAFVERRGFVSTLYKVPPEMLVDIANAKQVKIRLKGNNRVIERDLPDSARANFKKYLVKYYTPESVAADPSLRPPKKSAWPEPPPARPNLDREKLLRETQ